MILNKEIEFKCAINEAQYNDLIDSFDLKNNIFKQTNFYFDSVDQALLKQNTTLRIRLKYPNRYKLTLKTAISKGAVEQHIFLKENQALKLIENGFNVKDYFDTDLDVHLYGSLDNYRVSTPYKNGELFIDKIEYFNLVEYELEYEVDNYNLGLKDFKNFLKKQNIDFKKSLRKSERVFNHLKKL